jgi:alpha-L-fucosidase
VSIRPGWFWHENENGKVKTAHELWDLYFKSVGRGANLLLNVPPDRRGRLGETDIASLREFGELRRATFAKNLASGARMTASNFRGNNRRFAPENLVDGNPSTYWSTDDSVTTPNVRLEFPKPERFSVIRLRECIRLGQRVASFEVEANIDSAWRHVAAGTSIGNCRLIRLEGPVTTKSVRLQITSSPVSPALSELGMFEEPALE